MIPILYVQWVQHVHSYAYRSLTQHMYNPLREKKNSSYLLVDNDSR